MLRHFDVMLGKGNKVDPVTAIFNFLSTPMGQKILADLDAGIVSIIKDLIKVVHGNVTAPKT